jgi:hypothetical protein
MTNQEPDPGCVPYLEITDDSYAQKAAPTFRIEETRPGARVLRGQCPRCDAIIDIPVMPTVFGGSRWSITGLFHPADRKAADADYVEPVLCTCDAHSHAGRPEGRKGCGAYWNLLIRAASA